MTSPSDRFVRLRSSSEGGATDIAGQEGIVQASAMEGDAFEAEVDEQEEDVFARDLRVARRPTKPMKAVIHSHEFHACTLPQLV